MRRPRPARFKEPSPEVAYQVDMTPESTLNTSCSRHLAKRVARVTPYPLKKKKRTTAPNLRKIYSVKDKLRIQAHLAIHEGDEPGHKRMK